MRGLEVWLTLQKRNHLSKQFHSVSNLGFTADSIADWTGVFYIFIIIICNYVFLLLPFVQAVKGGGKVLLCPDLVTYEEIPASVSGQN